MTSKKSGKSDQSEQNPNGEAAPAEPERAAAATLPTVSTRQVNSKVMTPKEVREITQGEVDEEALRGQHPAPQPRNTLVPKLNQMRPNRNAAGKRPVYMSEIKL